MIDDKRLLSIDREQKWGDFVDRVCGFSDVKVINEINVLEELIDSDQAHESILFDAVLDLYESLRDECVRRVAKSVMESAATGDE